MDLFKLILGVLASLFRSRAKLEAEILILRQQINVLRRRALKRPHLNNTDRFLFVWLYHWFPSVLGAVAIVRPETIQFSAAFTTSIAESNFRYTHGSKLPILTTAIGRTFLAHLPKAVVQPLATSERRDTQFRGISVPSVEEMDDLMREIRSRRLSRAPSALFPGVDAIAAPVFDYRDNLVAVMCVVARSEAKITGWDGSAVRALAEVAAQLSARLGCSNEHRRPLKQPNSGEREAKTPVRVAASLSIRRR